MVFSGLGQRLKGDVVLAYPVFSYTNIKENIWVRVQEHREATKKHLIQGNSAIIGIPFWRYLLKKKYCGFSVQLQINVAYGSTFTVMCPYFCSSIKNKQATFATLLSSEKSLTITTKIFRPLKSTVFPSFGRFLDQHCEKKQ